MKYIITEEQLDNLSKGEKKPLNDVIEKIFRMEFPDFKDTMFIHYFKEGDTYFLLFPHSHLDLSFQQKIKKRIGKILDINISIFEKG